MGNYLFDLARIKAIPIAMVAGDLGFMLSRSGAGRCKLPHHDDSVPSFSIRRSTNSFTCYACGKKGSVIDLVLEMLDTDFRNACQWLEKRYLIRSTSPNRSFSPLPARIRDIPPQEPAARADPEVFGWLLSECPIQPAGTSYLLSRCISVRTQQHFCVGQIGSAPELLSRAIRKWTIPRLIGCGLVSISYDEPRLVFPSGHLLFPFLTGNAVTFLQARALGKPERKRWICPHRLLPTIHNANALTDVGAHIAICEGVTDVLSAHELNMAAIGILGAHAPLLAFPHSDWMRLLRGKDISIIPDTDKAGGQFATRLRRELAARDLTAHVKRLPSGLKDLNDYLVRLRSDTRESV